MTRKELKLKVKNEQKQLATDIKRGKFIRRPRNWSLMTPDEEKKYIYVYSDYGSNHAAFKNYLIDQLSVDYRAKHIAYCSFFNNTPYDKIENPRKDNKPNTSKIHSLRKEWESQIDVEAFCDCA
jgi:ribosomal protein L20